MSIKKGDYLGGIRTLDDLRKRCRIDEETGCWVWGLSSTQGSATVHFVVEGKTCKMRGPRAAATIARGKLIAARYKCWSTCGCELCVNPAHVATGTRAAHGAYMVKSGRSRTLAKQLSARSAAKKRRKLTQEQANEILHSPEPIEAIAKRMNVSRYAVWCIRQGKSWRGDTAANASVFTWRPQAA